MWIIKDNFATREGEDKGQRWRATLNGSQSEHCKGDGECASLSLYSLTYTIIRCYHSTTGPDWDYTGTLPGHYQLARARRRHAPYRARPLPRVGLAMGLLWDCCPCAAQARALPRAATAASWACCGLAVDQLDRARRRHAPYRARPLPRVGLAVGLLWLRPVGRLGRPSPRSGEVFSLRYKTLLSFNVYFFNYNILFYETDFVFP